MGSLGRLRGTGTGRAGGSLNSDYDESSQFDKAGGAGRQVKRRMSVAVKNVMQSQSRKTSGMGEININSLDPSAPNIIVSHASDSSRGPSPFKTPAGGHP